MLHEIVVFDTLSYEQWRKVATEVALDLIVLQKVCYPVYVAFPLGRWVGK
jgi:hypothetical protein